MSHNGRRQARQGVTFMIISIDFETYSEAGLVYRDGKWMSPNGKKKGIELVGTFAYVEHPSTRVICMAYDTGDGAGPGLWVPGAPFPEVLRGATIRGWNVLF